jgi:AcrR family transcriptional regulator
MCHVPAPAVPGRAAHKAARREDLIDAAVRVIRRDGPRVSIEDVAREVGVTRPILYRYFGDRRGLHLALAERFAQRLTAELDRPLTSGGPPRDVFAATVDTYLAFLDEDANVYRFLFGGGLGDEDRAFAHHLAHRIAEVMAAGLAAAGGDPSVAEAWGHALVGMVHMAGDWWVDQRPMPRERLVELLVLLGWDGMGGGGRPRP